MGIGASGSGGERNPEEGVRCNPGELPPEDLCAGGMMVVLLLLHELLDELAWRRG